MSHRVTLTIEVEDDAQLRRVVDAINSEGYVAEIDVED